MINGKGDVQGPVHGVFQLSRSLPQRQQLARTVFPDGLVTADMLQVNRDVAVAGPVPPQVLIALPRPAQAVRKNDHRERPGAVSRVVNFGRYLPLPPDVLPVGEQDRHFMGTGAAPDRHFGGSRRRDLGPLGGREAGNGKETKSQGEYTKDTGPELHNLNNFSCLDRFLAEKWPLYRIPIPSAGLEGGLERG